MGNYSLDTYPLVSVFIVFLIRYSSINQKNYPSDNYSMGNYPLGNYSQGSYSLLRLAIYFPFDTIFALQCDKAPTPASIFVKIIDSTCRRFRSPYSCSCSHGRKEQMYRADPKIETLWHLRAGDKCAARLGDAASEIYVRTWITVSGSSVSVLHGVLVNMSSAKFIYLSQRRSTEKPIRDTVPKEFIKSHGRHPCRQGLCGIMKNYKHLGRLQK